MDKNDERIELLEELVTIKNCEIAGLKKKVETLTKRDERIKRQHSLIMKKIEEKLDETEMDFEDASAKFRHGFFGFIMLQLKNYLK